MTTNDHFSPSLTAAIDAWRQHLQVSNVATRTLRAYSRDLKNFMDYLVHSSKQPISLEHLKKLETEDFRSYCKELTTQGKTPASVARALSTLRNFFRFLAEDGLAHNLSIMQVPVPRVAKPVRIPLANDEAFEAVQCIAELSDAPWIAKRDEALFALLFGSGLRLGEALALNRYQAPVEDQINVGTGPRQRVVPVLPFVPALIAEYLHICPYVLDARQPLFVGARGKRLNPGVVQRQMRRLRILLGLPNTATPHTLRLCFAQRLRAEGNDLQAIQHLLGHAYLTTTQRYPQLR